jgi:hypothetical protein
MFRTEIPSPTPGFNVDIKTPVLSIGSCFANDIGQRLADYKFSITTNPGGIIFNPCSIFDLLEMALQNQPATDHAILQRDGVFLSHKFHSEIRSTTEAGLLLQIESAKKALRDSIQQSGLIILTFGTAWVYKLKKDDTLVANCHKVPQKQFSKTLLSVEDITERFRALKKEISLINPQTKFLLTVSPVRHLKDTLALNSVSKSVLRLACHQLTAQYEEVDYFPSYELMMDDLRDYRFYERDMIHPTGQAVDYIWQKFTEAYFTPSSLAFAADWSQIRSAMQHRPFNPDSAAHQKFLKDLLKKVENHRGTVDVAKELSAIKSQLRK